MWRLLVLAELCACGRIGFAGRASADAAADDAPGGDGSLATACGTVALLADAFDGPTASPQWDTYANGGVTTAQSGGELVITLPAATSPGSNYGGYDSSWHYDLHGSRVFVEVTQTASVTTHAQTDLQAIGISGDELEISEEFGFLYASSWIGNMQTTIASIPYDPIQHRWWQLREDAGTVYFETSRDGASYTPFATTPTPAYASLLDVLLEAGSFQVETAAGAARFDNLNGATPSGTWCAASTLRDDFNGGVVDDRWGSAYSNGGCTYDISGGAANIALSPTGIEDCALVSASGFDLTGDSVFTELATAPNSAGSTYAYLRASTPAGDNVELSTSGANLVCAQNVGGVYSESSSVPYDAAAHKFLRLSEAGGDIVCETSADGATWNKMFAKPSPIALSAVNLAIGAGTNSAVPSPGTASFATFDQLPP